VHHPSTVTQVLLVLPEGTTEYTDCTGLLTQSSSAWPQTSLFEIAASGVAENKLIIGKPATSSDASNGYIDPSTLAGCVSQAVGQGWNGGVMVWEVCTSAAYSLRDRSLTALFRIVPRCRCRLDCYRSRKCVPRNRSNPWYGRRFSLSSLSIG
jgi:hypothetical protein